MYAAWQIAAPSSIRGVPGQNSKCHHTRYCIASFRTESGISRVNLLDIWVYLLLDWYVSMQISSTVYVSGSADLMLKVITMKNLELIAFVLLLIGGINWGLVGMFNYNLVTTLLGDGTTMTKVVYGMVGLGALYEAVKFFRGKCSASTDS